MTAAIAVLTVPDYVWRSDLEYAPPRQVFPFAPCAPRPMRPRKVSAKAPGPCVTCRLTHRGEC